MGGGISQEHAEAMASAAAAQAAVNAMGAQLQALTSNAAQAGEIASLQREMQRDRASAEADAARGRKVLEEMAASAEKDRAEMRETIAKLMQENKENEEAPFDPKDPDKLRRKDVENFDKFCAAAADYVKDIPKSARISIAVLGQSGVGKSSIINYFAGEEVAKTDVVECTQDISIAWKGHDYDFYDVPGSHDERADFFNIDNLHKLKSLHLVFAVYTDRFEHILKVEKLIKSIDVPFVLVRNKCDFARSEEDMARAYEEESKKAAGATVIHLGWTDKDTKEPRNFGKMRSIVEGLLTEARAGDRPSKKSKTEKH